MPPRAKRPRTDATTPVTKKAKRAAARAVLAAIPGASGAFSQAMQEDVLARLAPAVTLRTAADTRVRWNTRTAGAPKNVDIVHGLCPSRGDLDALGADGFFVLAHSFGNRVLCEMLATDALPLVKGVILLGYPLYGPKNNEERVDQLRLLPPGLPTLVVSGEKDEFLHRPFLDRRGAELMQSVVASLNLQHGEVHVLENGSHDLPKTKGKDQRNATLTTADRLLYLITKFCTGS
ncbi:hypothetical protein ACHHYP_16001 [Achlya hypogyna]|uniref:KANL3/Tex30 alpha/beta hydrolase-like domain-containing protein n=1 Tax=Achlya hypogyna TaxID=1202772 RepID=A0A1V9ZEQ3_ACHHY|nr:hypothetical protein ACHHYP_16001 [Achlya hypogyna]